MKYIVLFIKKIVLSICMLYAINLIISNVGTIIPINYYSIGAVAIFGLPAVVGLVVISRMV